MYHLATTLIAGIIATVFVSGIAFVPTPAEAAKSSACGMISLRTLALTKAPSRAAIWRGADGTHHRKAECAVHRRFQ
jgi:hypothetical protein